MDAAATRDFLRALGVARFGGRSGWVTCACPIEWNHGDGSGKASFGVKTGNGPIIVKCFSCDFHGTPADLVYEILGRNKVSPSGKPYAFAKALAILAANPSDLLEGGLQSIDEATWGAKPDFIFPDAWLAGFEVAYDEQTVHPYLAGRQVPCRVAHDLDLRFDPFRSRVCFPVRDFHGRLRGLHGRTIYDHVGLRYLMYTLEDEHGDKRCSPDVWLGEQWVDPERPVVVVESVFDLARVYQAYRNVITPLMASLNARKLARLAGIRTLVPMFDADKAGALAVEKLKKSLKGTAIIPVQSIGGYKDPGAAPIEIVAGILKHYVELDPILA
jgi:hypothetical protein